MTFDDDYVQIGDPPLARYFCKANGIEWPPPKKIETAHGVYVQVSLSQITDEQRAGMTHVARGALYEPEEVQANEVTTHGNSYTSKPEHERGQDQ